MADYNWRERLMHRLALGNAATAEMAFSIDQTISKPDVEAAKQGRHVFVAGLARAGTTILTRQLYESGVDFAEGWNFGPTDEDARPVEWVVRHLCEKWGGGANYQIDVGEHPHEANYLKLDCSKARSRLGWQPRWELSLALEKIVEWIRLYMASGDMQQGCLKQIREYGEME